MYNVFTPTTDAAFNCMSIWVYYILTFLRVYNHFKQLMHFTAKYSIQKNLLLFLFQFRTRGVVYSYLNHNIPNRYQ